VAWCKGAWKLHEEFLHLSLENLLTASVQVLSDSLANFWLASDGLFDKLSGGSLV